MVPKSKIRRRRKKITADPPADTRSQPDPSHSPSTNNDQTKHPYRFSIKPKVNAVHLRGEKEIMLALSNRTKDTADDDSRSPNSLEFFTDGLMEIEDSDEKLRTNQRLSSAEDNKTLSDSTDGQQLVSSFVIVEEDAVVQQWRPELVEKPDADLFMEKEVTKKADVEDQSENDAVSLEELRNVEDDGLFVYKQLSRIKEINENFLIERLLLANHKDCVRVQNGRRQLVMLQKFRDDSGKLFRSVCSKEFIAIHYEPRSLQESGTVNVSDRTSQLHLFIESIEWDALNDEANQEEILTKTIQDLFVEYQRSNQVNNIGRLEQKLQSIRILLEQYEGIPESRDVEQFIFDRRDLRNKIHREQKSMRDNILGILDKWLQLKDLRKKQGFAKTNLKLVIRTTETDMEEDQKRWDLDFNAELNEVLEEALQFYNKGKRRHDGEGDGPEVELKKPNPEEIEDMLHDIFMRSRRHPGEPIVRLEVEQQKMELKENTTTTSTKQSIGIRVNVGKQKKEMVRKAACMSSKVVLNVEFKLQVDDGDADGCHVAVSSFNFSDIH